MINDDYYFLKMVSGEEKFTGFATKFYKGKTESKKILPKGKYEGEWKDGLRHGKGIYIWGHSYDDGWPYKYNGEWKDGKQNGNGIMVYKQGIYNGEWKDNKRHGSGIFYKMAIYKFDREKPIMKFLTEYKDGWEYLYEGGWKDGKRHGYGVENTNNGERSEGEWKDCILISGKMKMTIYTIKGKLGKAEEVKKLRKTSQKNALAMVLNKKIKLGTMDDINQMLILIGY